MRKAYMNRKAPAPGRAEAGGEPPFYSSQLPPCKLHGAQGVIDEINQVRKIAPGHITPKLPKRLPRKLNAELDIYEPEILCRLILRYCGFDERGFGYGALLASPVLVNDWLEDGAGRQGRNVRMLEYAMLLQTFQILHLSYQGIRRESGNGWMTHPLRAALFVAALGAPARMVVSALLHDILEDAMSRELPAAKFRAFARKGKAHSQVEFSGEGEIMDYIRGNYWHYGAKIARDVWHATRNDIRKEAINAEYLANPALYEKLYREHLRKAHTRIGSAFAKAGDSKANITEIKSIGSPAAREMKLGKRLLKLGWQLESGWNKIAWPVFECLLYDLEALGGEKSWKRHRFVPAEAIWGFAEGYNLIGKPHRYMQEVRDRLMPSRSPAIEIYTLENRPSFTFEFPFISDAREAIGMVEAAFGKGLANPPKEVDSLLPARIRGATLVSADFYRSPKVGRLDDLVAAYDEKLDGIMEGGFDRELLAQAAWDRHYRLKKEQKL